MPVQRLIAALDQLTDIYSQLLELAEKKKEALVRNSVNDVSAITNKESKLNREIDVLLAEQKSATNEFFQSKGFQPTRAITITELSRMVTDIEAKNSLLASRDRLTDVVHKVKRLNELNQQLIQSSVAFINYSLDLLLGPEDDSVYRHPTVQKGKSAYRPGYFDSKA